ncbi:hypothetical protein F4859DRAFT_361746 [Xylaria cf. heliscus]|nr:hypothetical protein F4859DRAFT_361746 [Xylaria cf. heliscus]
MEEPPDVEILIHIGAPSRTVDDARYRSLAAAYLAFEPTGPIHLHAQSSNDSGVDDSRHVPETDEYESSNIPSDDRIGSFRSPQASFRSVVDNADSPQMRTCEVRNHPFLQQTPASAIQASQSSWETPPNIVQDSHPMNHAEFTSLTSPTRVLENYLQHFESFSGSPKPDSQSNILDTPYRYSSQHHGRRLSPRKMTPCTQKVIPCTPYVRNITEIPSNSREGSDYPKRNKPQEHPEAIVVDAFDDNIIEETTFFSSSQPSELLRADSEPPPKSHKLGLVTSPRALARAASDIGPQSLPNYKAPVTIKFLSSHGFTYESLEISYLEPPTSESHIEPQDLITEGLQRLGRDVGLPSRFRPKQQTRELRPYERGHWLLDCSSWEPRLKRDAWAFLANYIGTGTAGWGVLCRRDRDFRELRAYCWGSVVAHIYYVLWLSSQRKIVFTGSTWIDAGGARVIVMGSRDHSQR